MDRKYREEAKVDDEPGNSQKDLFDDSSPPDIKIENYAASTVIDMEAEDMPWKGKPLVALCTNIGKELFPPVKPSADHTVLFKKVMEMLNSSTNAVLVDANGRNSPPSENNSVCG